MVPCVDIFMTSKTFWHGGRRILAGFIHQNLLSKWFKCLKHLSTSVLIDILNFLLGNIKATRQTILSSHINRLLCRRKWLRSLSISARQELWLLCRRRRRWHFPHGALGLIVLSRRRRWTFPHGVLELLVLCRRRRRSFPHDVLELWDLSKRRR
jgi:hypothetical protein